MNKSSELSAQLTVSINYTTKIVILGSLNLIVPMIYI